MDLRALAAERRAREQAAQQRQAPVLSDQQFLELLFQPPPALLSTSEQTYLRSRYNATPADYQFLLNSYYEDTIVRLTPIILPLLGPTIRQVLEQVLAGQLNCTPYGEVLLDELAERYREILNQLQQAQQRSQAFLQQRNQYCSQQLYTVQSTLQELLASLQNLPVVPLGERASLANHLLAVAQRLQGYLREFFDLCWENGLISGPNRFQLSKYSNRVALRDLPANAWADALLRANEQALEAITGGDEYCYEYSGLCLCVYDEVAAHLALRLGLKEKYVTQQGDFAFLYYEFLAIRDIVYQNFGQATLFDSGPFLQLLAEQIDIRQGYLVTIEQLVREAAEQLAVIHLAPEEFTLRLLLRDIFQLIKQRLGLAFDIVLETNPDLQADWLLAQQLAQGL